MNRNRLMLGIVASLSATVALASSANARTVNGADSIASLGSAHESWGAAVNSASGTTQYLVTGLPVDSSGSYSPQINVLAPKESSDVVCYAVATDRFSGSHSYYFGSPQTFGSPTVLPLGPVSVPPGGYLYTSCYLNGDGATLYSVIY
jgi:hypothetical protein